MARKGYDPDFADAIFKQICGFGEYGFPESHAYSFALLAYVSLWLKCHEPAIFLAALINSQPMGFYAPSQLVQDARRHGVEVRPIDVCASDWDCTLERRAEGGAHPAVRLGLRLVSTLSQAAAERLTQARRTQGFASVDDLARRAQLDARDLQALAQADALQSLAGHRRRQLWTAAGQERVVDDALLADAPIVERAHEQPDLFEAAEGEAITLDYAATGLTLRRHPLALLRSRLNQRGWRSAEQLAQLQDGADRLGLRHRDDAPATRNRQGRHLRHARRRNRQRQHHRLAPHPRAPAHRVAALTPARGGRAVAGQGRQHALDRAAAGGRDAVAGRAGHALEGFSLSAVACTAARRPPRRAADAERDRAATRCGGRRATLQRHPLP